jgi:hypothetical protein
MCYTNRNWSREEEEARRLRAEDARRDYERDVRPVSHEDPEKKPLTEKVKETSGVR